MAAYSKNCIILVVYRTNPETQLRCFGHIVRHDSSSLEKTTMLGLMDGGRSSGRPRCRWTNGVEELVGESLANCKRQAQERGH